MEEGEVLILEKCAVDDQFRRSAESFPSVVSKIKHYFVFYNSSWSPVLSIF